MSTVTEYARLISMAREICRDRHHSFDDGDDWIRLEIVDEVATIYRPRARAELDDSCCLEWDTASFPAWLFDLEEIKTQLP